VNHWKSRGTDSLRYPLFRSDGTIEKLLDILKMKKNYLDFVMAACRIKVSFGIAIGRGWRFSEIDSPEDPRWLSCVVDSGKRKINDCEQKIMPPDFPSIGATRWHEGRPVFGSAPAFPKRSPFS
jgi:hypothetical protein